MTVKFTWLGHSAFSFDIDGHNVLVDPFLTGNQLAPIKPEDAAPEVILLTHGHGDHVGDTIDIAKRTGAMVAANFEVCNWLAAQGLENVNHMNPGGTLDLGWMRVKWTIAHHSSSMPDGSYGGQPNGLLFTIGDRKLYFAGDTSLFMDMQLIGMEGLDVAFLPIGDKFTMGPEDSLKAIEFLRPRHVVPMHYNTFDPIVQDVAQWARDVNSKTLSNPIVLDPGGSHSL
ncbi:MAG: metal-dependent hydrolase [Anaerolineaceae bacterium]|nr:MAG: metal-dependent hydrolase [Anaerolineaceae bacterium]